MKLDFIKVVTDEQIDVLIANIPRQLEPRFLGNQLLDGKVQGFITKFTADGYKPDIREQIQQHFEGMFQLHIGTIVYHIGKEYTVLCTKEQADKVQAVLDKEMKTKRFISMFEYSYNCAYIEGTVSSDYFLQKTSQWWRHVQREYLPLKFTQDQFDAAVAIVQQRVDTFAKNVMEKTGYPISAKYISIDYEEKHTKDSEWIDLQDLVKELKEKGKIRPESPWYQLRRLQHLSRETDKKLIARGFSKFTFKSTGRRIWLCTDDFYGFSYVEIDPIF